MTSLRFAHAADLHLGSPFRGLTHHKQELGALLREASYRALSKLVWLCLRERVDFLLLAGDLFDQKDRSLRAQLALREALMELERGGVKTFLVHGNHDPLSGDRGTLSWPAGTHVFGAQWEEVPVWRGGEVIARVQGISYGQEAVKENLARRFARRGPEFSVGLLHSNVGGNAGHQNYAPCTQADLAAADLDYWALGHVHLYQEMPLSRGLAVYPGCLQARHAQEGGAKGCALVEVKAGVAKARFVPLDAVRFHQIGLSIEGEKTLDGLESALESALDERSEEPVLAHALRLNLTGRGNLHRELSSQRAQEWEESLAERLSLRSPPWLLESLRRSTSPEISVEALASSGGLPQAVWEEALRLGEDPQAREELLGEDSFVKLASALKRAGLPREVELNRSQLLRAATSALELLAGEEGR